MENFILCAVNEEILNGKLHFLCSNINLEVFIPAMGNCCLFIHLENIKEPFSHVFKGYRKRLVARKVLNTIK